MPSAAASRHREQVRVSRAIRIGSGAREPGSRRHLGGRGSYGRTISERHHRTPQRLGPRVRGVPLGHPAAPAHRPRSSGRRGGGLSMLLVSDLQRLAQELGITGTGRMRKGDSSPPLGADRRRCARPHAVQDNQLREAASAGADAARPLNQDAMEADTSARSGHRRSRRRRRRRRAARRRPSAAGRGRPHRCFRPGRHSDRSGIRLRRQHAGGCPPSSRPRPAPRPRARAAARTAAGTAAATDAATTRAGTAATSAATTARAGTTGRRTTATAASPPRPSNGRNGQNAQGGGNGGQTAGPTARTATARTGDNQNRGDNARPRHRRR